MEKDAKTYSIKVSGETAYLSPESDSTARFTLNVLCSPKKVIASAKQKAYSLPKDSETPLIISLPRFATSPSCGQEVGL
jgi:hypothetical protein